LSRICQKGWRTKERDRTKSKLAEMAVSYFNIQQIRQELVLDPSEVAGLGKAGSPCLFVAIRINFTPYRADDRSKYSAFYVTGLMAELTLTGAGLSLYSHTVLQGLYIFRPDQSCMALKFPLTSEKTFMIEKYRQGDVSATLQLDLQIAHLLSLGSIKPGANDMEVFTRFETAQARIPFVIAQSHWVNRVLPGIGYDGSTLFEIAGRSVLLPEPYAVAKEEILEARRYFVAGDYDKAVAHCRAAIEPVKKAIGDTKNHFASESKFDWINTQFEATFTYLDKMLKANYALASKSHHPPSSGNFSRAEAETMVGITSHLLSYLGTILPDTFA